MMQRTLLIQKYVSLSTFNRFFDVPVKVSVLMFPLYKKETNENAKQIQFFVGCEIFWMRLQICFCFYCYLNKKLYFNQRSVFYEITYFLCFPYNLV